MTTAGRVIDRLKREILICLGREPRVALHIRVASEVHGSNYGSFAIRGGSLSPDSVVYSAGVGEDVTFDLSLIRTYGATIHAFDPTPRSIDWVSSQALPPQYHFHPWAIGDKDGTIDIFPPADPAHVSHRAIPAGDGRQPLRVTARRLSSIARELGHSRVDLLKMDVEGFEYDILADLVRSGPSVDQIVVEFHHHFDEIPVSRTTETLENLHRAGYRVFHVSPRGHEISLLHTSVLPNA